MLAYLPLRELNVHVTFLKIWTMNKMNLLKLPSTITVIFGLRYDRFILSYLLDFVFTVFQKSFVSQLHLSSLRIARVFHATEKSIMVCLLFWTFRNGQFLTRCGLIKLRLNNRYNDRSDEKHYIKHKSLRGGRILLWNTRVVGRNGLPNNYC